MMLSLIGLILLCPEKLRVAFPIRNIRHQSTRPFRFRDLHFTKACFLFKQREHLMCKSQLLQVASIIFRVALSLYKHHASYPLPGTNFWRYLTISERLQSDAWHGNALLSCGPHKLDPQQKLSEFNGELVACLGVIWFAWKFERFCDCSREKGIKTRCVNDRSIEW